ncbi:MAG: T9SS C-terminal target domain-containing protein [Calditrichaeota bacterium]|nr:MAG: T9SS C-terminal target domain-containing protein [Calditrichota bacterium]MBL1205771.1 T9SS C-terminal target domain-containing protein [Calditrichota bacterium]NOG45599.1 T9SS type A sorting domain-containing protein [Calditrichota bacterium]
MKNEFYINLILSILILSIVSFPLFAGDLSDKHGANIAKTLTNLDIKPVDENRNLEKSTEQFWKKHTLVDKIGQTFEVISFDKNNGIKKFNREASRTFLKRDLFGLPQYTASYYYAKYDKNSVFVESTYLQVISDTRWNRLLYGSLDGALKSYNDIIGPGEIVSNSQGQIFVAEKGKSRILVFKVTGSGKEAELQLSYTIEGINEPTSLAYNDGGTPFDPNDGFLFVADASQNTITKWKVNAASAEKLKIYRGFKWPVSIGSGKWNGANTNQLYVIDSYAKKITLYEESDEELTELSQVQALTNQTFSKIEVDHFGQIYLSDAVNGELYKLTANLEILDSKKMPQNSGINDLSIPFGTVEIVGEGKYWAGFDQLFALQTWNDESGVERLKLGLALQNQTMEISEHNDLIKTEFTITDFAETGFSVFTADNKKIFESEKVWNASGKNSLTWTRSNESNGQVKQGFYKFELEIKSAYQEETLIRESSFYLPLYYHINCGDEDGTEDIALVRGQSKKLNGQFYIEGDVIVEYKISGLDAASEYKISTKFLNLEGNESHQNIQIDGIYIYESTVPNMGSATDYLSVPKETFADGEIQILVSGDENNPVLVSDIWLKESGRNFTLQDPQKVIPTDFKLEQNYPNPFNPTTSISYQLPNAGEVELSVFDMLGRKIETLVNSFQDAGIYSINFDGSNLASGLYFYQLKTGKQIETRKMLLVK